MYEVQLTKPDGRQMSLYSRRPIQKDLVARSPRPDPVHADPQLRWHPLRGEWVAYAAYRQTRTFLPPPQYNPLAPSDSADSPTELPVGDYDIAVFDNLFPALSLEATPSTAELIVPTRPATGHCEVVAFTQDPSTSLGALPVAHIALLLEVWARRTQAISQRSSAIRYVLPFENRGAEVGVTLHHPHGQIYAYPFVPPVPERMHGNELKSLRDRGTPLLASLIDAEIRDGRRILYQSELAVAFVPAWARYPYEVWVAPRRQRPDFGSLLSQERVELAQALQRVLRKYDGLWGVPFPYIMAWYQAPIAPEFAAACHLHAEIYPAYRMRDRLKYLAGTEIAAGMFANDALPEDKAQELQAVKVAQEDA